MERVYAAMKALWNSPIRTVSYVRAWPWWLGIVAGAIGTFAPFLSSLLGRIFLGTSPAGDLRATLYLFPFTLVFFVLFALVQAGVGRLFGGRLKLLSFVGDVGWAWFPLVVISGFLALLIWAASRFSDAAGFSAVDLAAVISVLAILVSALWTVRFQYGILKDSLSLSPVKTACVYVLTWIPGLYVIELIDLIG